MISSRSLTRSIVVLAALAAAAVLPAAAFAGPTTTIQGPTKPVTTGFGSSGASFALRTEADADGSVGFLCSTDSPLPSLFNRCANPDPSCAPTAVATQVCTLTVPLIYAPITNGTHTFRAFARFCETGGDCYADPDDGPVASFSYVVDNVAPKVTIVSGPSLTDPILKKNGALLTFTADKPATFECEIDRVQSPCTSPVTLKRFANGRHRISVYPRSVAGARGLRTTRDFRVDIYHPKSCKRGHSAKAKSAFRKCKKQRATNLQKWKQKHHLK